MIKITNISVHPTADGINHYHLEIPNRLEFEFSHDRSKGLAQCLRDAADEYEKITRLEPTVSSESVVPRTSPS